MDNHLEKALTVLLLKSPFFGSLALKLPVRANPAIPTARICTQWIEYNPTFVESLPLDQQVFLLAHEINHHVLGHLGRMRHYVDSGVGPDGEPFDGKRWAKAIDYIDNAVLIDAGIGSPIPGGCYSDKVNLQTDTPESLYLAEPSPRNGAKGGGGGGKPLDEHDPHPGEEGEEGVSGDGESPITDAAIAAAAATSKALGKPVPGVVERYLGTLIKPTYNPWRQLRAEVNSARGHPGGTSWRRLDRHMMARGIGVPGRTKVGADTVGIIVDVSGSIDNEELARFMGHMGAILEETCPRLIRVYWTDSEVRRVDLVKSTGDLVALGKKGAPGGGGTDMTRGLRAAADDRCDSVVCMTDGYTPFGSASLLPQRTRMIWAITSDVVAPWGVNIHLRSRP